MLSSDTGGPTSASYSSESTISRASRGFKTERTKDWVRLLPVISLMMKSQESSATGYSPHELFMGCPAWLLQAPYSGES